MLNQIYYRFKPLLPWHLRIKLRRILARHRRKTCQAVWPINEGAGSVPNGWPGWPEGKKFALVLTHDVEGASGLEKCRQLMELEKGLGFHSSFNFIPEGEYEASGELREELVRNDFEVGVHDLRHDGVSRLFEMGLSIPRAASVSGHRSWQSLKRYTHIRQAGDKYENWQWLERICPAEPATT